MRDRWERFTTALESMDSNQVNDVVHEIKEMDLEQRVELFDVCFDELTEMYATTADGYVHQSVVRVADQLMPDISTVSALDHADRSIGADATDLQQQTDALCGFLLEAITDDDGRFRQSAKRGLTDVFRTYDALDDEETFEALVRELDEMASPASGKREKHLLEAKEDARFTLQSGIARVLEDFQGEFGDETNRGT